MIPKRPQKNDFRAPGIDTPRGGGVGMPVKDHAKAEVVRWQLDLPTDRARDLDAFGNTYGFASRKDLVNTALSLLQWSIDEVRAGRIIASLDEQTMRYKQLDLPAFKIAAAKKVIEVQEPAVSIARMQAELESLLAHGPLASSSVPTDKELFRKKIQAAEVALAQAAAVARG